MIIGSIVTSLLDFDRASEFAGDDVDQYSALVDLGREYSSLIITIPTIESSPINIYVQNLVAIATVPTLLHYRLTSTEATGAWATTASTGGLTIVCDCLGGFRWVRIRCTTNQTADRVFTLRGMRA